MISSRQERGETSFDNFPAVAAAASAMFLGLETAPPFLARGDWDWDAATAMNNPVFLSLQREDQFDSKERTAVNNPVFLSLQREDQFDSKERKPQITTSVSPFRPYSSPEMEMGMPNSPVIRSFAASSSLSRGGLLYSQVSGFGTQGYDPRSQLLEMTSMKEPSYRKEGTIFHDMVKRKDACEGDFQAGIGLNLGQRTYFPPENCDLSRLYKRSRTAPAACQVEGCRADLSHSKHYHRRHKVCEYHSKAGGVITGGVQQRFCQQCSRFHALSEFDEMKRSCRKRLADHNRRRRKPHPNAAAVAPAANADQAASTALFKAFNAKC